MSNTQKAMVDISVIIPTYCRDVYLAETLLDILKQKGGFEKEIIVVDQNEEPLENRNSELRDLIEREQMLVIHCPFKGVVFGRNSGIDASRGEIIVFIDDDVSIEDENFLSKHLALHRDNTELAAVCGREINPGGLEKVDQIDYARKNGISDVLFFPRNFSEPIEATVLSTCNCSIKRSVLVQLGCFDENYSGASYGDDSDLALRMEEKGCKILYHPDPFLVHLMAPMGGLRLSQENKFNRFSNVDRVLASIIFYFKHIKTKHSELKWFYIYSYILRKTVFLKGNILRPWRLPGVAVSLIKAYFIARNSVKKGHKFSF